MKEDKKAYKLRLFQFCKSIIQERIYAAQKAMDNAQEASNSEEKSSAGDKYETSRAMGHIEKDMHAKQLEANKLELSALLSIDITHKHETVDVGAFVDCRENKFFIAAGLGKVFFEEENIFVLSPKAPLLKVLFGKKQNDNVIFNNKEIIIVDVF